MTNAPERRANHTAVWTGTQMIVWGGEDGLLLLSSGGRYNPGTDNWTAISATGAPTARGHSHSSMERQRDDRLGWIRSYVAVL